MPVSKFVPILEDAITFPLASVASSELVIPENHVVPNVPSVVDAFPKPLSPLHVLLFASSVEDAAVIVNDPPAVIALLFMVASVPVSRFVPIEEDAISLPVASSARRDEAVTLENHASPATVRPVVEAVEADQFMQEIYLAMEDLKSQEIPNSGTD